MDIKELIRIVKEKGVAGAGGAGFPSYVKLDKRADTIIVNCAECEPLLKVHRQLLKQYAYEIMSTLRIMAESMEVEEVIIGVKEAYHETVNAVKEYLDSFPMIKLKLLEEIYPMGDEVVLIYETTGKQVQAGSIPIEIGVAVFNVETVYNIYKALHYNEAVYSKYLTIAGEVHKAITIKAPIGMRVEDAIKLAGGITRTDVVYIMGGPMTGTIVEPYDTITKTSNAILVFPREHYIINKKLSNTSINMKRAMASCCQCEMCTDLCPRNLLGHPIKPHAFMHAASSGLTQNLAPFMDTLYCCSCGICELYACPQDLAPRRLITEYKDGLRKNGIAIPKVEAKEVTLKREYRKIPMDRLISRLNIKKYDIDAPLLEDEIIANQVKIPLSQHIGAKAIATVEVNDVIKQGDKIAREEDGKLSIPVHASISGKVIEVNDNFIRISKINAS